MCEGVVASAENAAGIVVRSIEIGCSGEITLTTVAVISFIVLATPVVPIIGACSLAQFSLCVSIGVVGDCMDGGTRLAIKYGEVFVSTVDASGTRAMVLCVVGSLDDLVSGNLVHIISLSIFGAGSRFAHHFGLAVTIVVVHLELSVVGTGANIHAQIYSPEFGAVKLIAVNVDIVCLTVIGVVL